jgi:hypothetical protein
MSLYPEYDKDVRGRSNGRGVCLRGCNAVKNTGHDQLATVAQIYHLCPWLLGQIFSTFGISLRIAFP